MKYHTTLEKTFSMINKSIGEKYLTDDLMHSEYEICRICREDAKGLFDCTSLDFGFLVETGIEYAAELENNKAPLNLPMLINYFEFADFAVIASNALYFSSQIKPEEAHGRDELQVCDAQYYYEITTLSVYDLCRPLLFRETYIEIGNYEMLIDSPEDYKYICGVLEDDSSSTNYISTDDERTIAYAVLGVMCLMSEQLIKKSIHREVIEKNYGKTKIKKITPYHVLTLNLAETHRRTIGMPFNKHESPRLHWRRGHWRTIHRYTDDERKTWVKKCLVGDPRKGFSDKHYKLKYKSTIH